MRVLELLQQRIAEGTWTIAMGATHQHREVCLNHPDPIRPVYDAFKVVSLIQRHHLTLVRVVVDVFFTDKTHRLLAHRLQSQAKSITPSCVVGLGEKEMLHTLRRSSRG